jgi:hypothetical protein
MERAVREQELDDLLKVGMKLIALLSGFRSTLFPPCGIGSRRVPWGRAAARRNSRTSPWRRESRPPRTESFPRAGERPQQRGRCSPPGLRQCPPGTHTMPRRGESLRARGATVRFRGERLPSRAGSARSMGARSPSRTATFRSGADDRPSVAASPRSRGEPRPSVAGRLRATGRTPTWRSRALAGVAVRELAILDQGQEVAPQLDHLGLGHRQLVFEQTEGLPADPGCAREVAPAAEPLELSEQGQQRVLVALGFHQADQVIMEGNLCLPGITQSIENERLQITQMALRLGCWDLLEKRQGCVEIDQCIIAAPKQGEALGDDAPRQDRETGLARRQEPQGKLSSRDRFLEAKAGQERAGFLKGNRSCHRRVSRAAADRRGAGQEGQSLVHMTCVRGQGSLDRVEPRFPHRVSRPPREMTERQVECGRAAGEIACQAATGRGDHHGLGLKVCALSARAASPRQEAGQGVGDQRPLFSQMRVCQHHSPGRC